MKELKWVLLLLLASAIWGSTFFLVKQTLPSFGAVPQTAMRFALAAIILGLYFAITRRKITRDEMGCGAVLGIIVFAYYAAQAIGLGFITATNNAFITSLSVLFVPVLSAVILGKMPQKKVWVAAAVALAGLWLLTGAGGSFGWGDAITLLAAMLIALHVVYNWRFVQKQDALNLIFVQISVAAAFGMALVLILGQMPARYPADAVGNLVYLAVFAILVAQIIFIYSLKYIEASKAVIINMSEPIFAAIFGALFLGEAITLSQALGAGLILLAIFMAESDRFRF